MFTDKIIESLFLPITDKLINEELKDKNILFINRVINDKIEKILSNTNTDFIQIFFPLASEIIKRNYSLNPELKQKYDFIFLLAPKQKQETTQMIITGLNALKKDGYFICSAANNAGGKSLISIVKKIADFNIEKLSKNKSQTIWFKNNLPIKTDNKNQGWIKICDNRFWSKSGIYGWNKIDKGSELLVNNLPEKIYGHVADYGCGYGFISCHLLNHYKDITNLYFIDADLRAVDATEKNLNEIKHNSIKHKKWNDITNHNLIKENKMDFIIMNPPFHEGKKSDANIGIKFINSAYKNLKKGGYLYMTANKHLPYEETLNNLFNKSEKIKEQEGFKIFSCKK